MDNLTRKRGTIKAAVTRIENYINAVTAQNIVYEEITSRLEKLEGWSESFEDVQMQIELEKPDQSDIEAEEEERAKFEEKYFKLKGKFVHIINERSKSKESQNDTKDSLIDDSKELGKIAQSLAENQELLCKMISNISTQPITNLSNTSGEKYMNTVKLPPINLPYFSGDFKDWVSFKDLYSSLVHTNESLSAVQKFQFLKTSLQGEANSIIKHLPVTDANYTEAWEQLTSRYDKKRFIIDAHLQTIMSQSMQSGFLKELKAFYNTVTESVRALKALELAVDKWDCWLVFVIVGKLDPESRQLWAREIAEIDCPTYDQITKFMERRVLELESIKGSSKGCTTKIHVPSSRDKPTSKPRTFSYASTTFSCPKCCGKHFAFNCPSFRVLDVIQRWAFVKEKSLCINCLSSAHSLKQCKSGTCRVCQQQHNTLLHSEQKLNVKPATSASVTLTSQTTLPTEIFLPTAVALVKDCSGAFQTCRILLDSGSQSTLVTESCIQRLRLHRQHARIPISGIGPESSFTKGKVILTIASKLTSETFNVSAFILPKLACKLPGNNVETLNATEFLHLQLADPLFNKANTVDIILGADMVFKVLRDGRTSSTMVNLVAQNTIFGWVIAGQYFNKNIRVNGSVNFHVMNDVDHQLKRFWELEEMPKVTHLTEEETSCENHYISNHKRRPDGRYEVCLPFKDKCQELGNSYSSAMHRLYAVERKFARNPRYKQQYCDFMQEYLELGHMSEITESERQLKDNNSTYYLPHHGVLRPDHTTTKLRVVFDASAPTTLGSSLNDNLMVGPATQSDLISILLRFRKHRYAFVADIAKMYRQVAVSENDVHFQRILWRSDPSRQIKEFKLQTITYGTASAPFLATRTLNQLAYDEEKTFPRACNILRNHFYVDDLLSGCDSVHEAKVIISELIQLLNSGGFELRKWKSNSDRIFENLTEGHSQSTIECQIITDESTKTLGLWWHPNGDYFSFKVNLSVTVKPSKREILSDISKIYDPLGWISPCIIQVKIIIQRIWLAGINWDDTLPAHLELEWLNLREELQAIHQIHIPRWMETWNMAQLHGFADASEAAYGAVVYLKTQDMAGKVHVNIVSSKSKVAPIKQVTLPRLELCAVHLLAKLFNKIKTAMKCERVECFGYTDSTIVLAWLAAHPKKWKTFVANRTAEILEEISYSHWFHVSSRENPADHVSRGLSPSQLLECKEWWNGPDFLQSTEITSCSSRPTFSQGEVPEERNVVFHAVTKDGDQQLILQRYSNLTRLIRIVAWCSRFIRNSRRKGDKRRLGPLSVAELDESLTICIRQIQSTVFEDELAAIKSNKALSPKCSLKALNPFVDSQGLLRVGGRLSEGDIPFDTKYPIILPKDHYLTNLLLLYLHQKYLHAGPRLLLSIICQRYWIIGARQFVRNIIFKCVTCKRHRAIISSQQMGNLPKPRIEPSRPFANTGVDYAGPFNLRTWKGRGAKTVKGYVCLFVCLATKALHLELASDLTTEAFLAALRRFISRRGFCVNIYSDNGKNFVGAHRELQAVANLIHSSEFGEQVPRSLSNLGINWDFIPPSAPHFGGLWEAGVKSVKFHMKRTMGYALLTFEEMTTLLCQIEAVLNSRPLSSISGDSNNFDPLTPNHFLVGGPIMTIPEVSFDDININRLTRWQYIQSLQQNFWTRWRKDYISSLQARTKWFHPHPNLQPHAVVIIKEDGLPPGKWLMGKVLEVHPGRDNLVRVATVLTKNGILRRPIAKLCPLLDDNNENH